MADHVATAETEIEAEPSRVWTALTDPDEIEKYMFGSRVVTDWRAGSSIVWKGEYEGKPYEDRGEILEVEPQRRLKMTHSAPGANDGSERFHTIVYELEGRDGRTRVSLRQDGNPSEEAAEHSRANWERMLAGLKEVVEQG